MAEVSVATDMLQSFVRRIESLDDEILTMNADKSEVYKEAKGNGFDVKVLRKLISDRRKDSNERVEFETIYELYAEALGMRLYREEGDKPALVRAHVETIDEFPADEDSSDSVKARIAAIKSNPAMAIVAPSEIKSQPAPQAGSDLTNSPALTGQVATIPAAVEAPRSSQEIDVGGSREAHTQAGEAQVEERRSPKPEDTGSIPVTHAIYAEPGVVTWEVAPPEGVERHQYSMAFGTLGQDIAVIEDDMKNACSAPIVKIGRVILDGWARYMAARDIGIEYPVRQYDGTDPLIDCIKWNFEGRLLTSEQKFRIAQAFAKAEPKRKADVYAAMELGMELVG